MTPQQAFRGRPILCPWDPFPFAGCLAFAGGLAFFAAGVGCAAVAFLVPALVVGFAADLATALAWALGVLATCFAWALRCAARWSHADFLAAIPGPPLLMTAR